MKDLVEYILKSILREPDAVNITEENSDEGLLLKVEVAPKDKGRAIGKQGRVAQAIRTLLHVKAVKEEASRIRIEIM